MREAIASILEQTFSDLELVVINDGSTDNSKAIIHSFSDARIVYLENARNLGLIATLNKGITACRGAFIARMDADDISLPQRLQKQLDYLKLHSDVAVLATRLVLINSGGKETGCWNDDFETLSREEIRGRMPRLNCIGHPTVMVRAAIIKRFGYNKKFKAAEDWGLWLTLLAEHHTIAKLDETLLKYRQHDMGTMVNANKDNVSRRIIRFKRSYLLDKLFRFRLKAFDAQVARYLLIDSLKYYFPFAYSFLIKLAGTRFRELLRQLSAFNRVFNHFPADSTAIFFFPFYHLGGAEKVHAEIVEAVRHTRPVVLFTSSSASNTLLPAFKKNARTLEIEQLLIWPFIKKKVIRKLDAACAMQPRMTLFSSNSRFYYDYLSKTAQQTKALDLVHAFMHPHEDSAEKWSLPVVEKLSTRVVINTKTAGDLERQYRENSIPPEMSRRILYISNYVNFYDKPAKDMSGLIKLLYVGRGTSEKRVHLLARIASEIKKDNLPVEFHFAGDVAAAIPGQYLQDCILHGEVRDEQQLHELYSACHILAMASTREGFPIVIMEGMMHGLATITSAVGGIPQHVSSGENGILIHDLEPDAFVAAFKKELAQLLSNRQKLSGLGNNAYHYASSNFNKQHFTEAYNRLFA